MTGLEVSTQRIRDAFDHDLGDYRAPADLAERARLGGLRRARSRRLRRWAYAAGAACAALGLAAALTLAAGSSAQPVHVRLAAWSVTTNPDGTVTFKLRKITPAAGCSTCWPKRGFRRWSAGGRSAWPRGGTTS